MQPDAIVIPSTDATNATPPAVAAKPSHRPTPASSPSAGVVAPTAVSVPRQGKFSVAHPDTTFRGEIYGVTFVGGVGHTDSAIAAHALLEHRCVATDLRCNLPAFTPEALAANEAAKA